MQKLSTLYTSRKTDFQQKLQQLKKQLLWSSMLRLFVFLLIMLLVYWFWGNTKLVVGSILFGIVAFLFLVSRHSNLQYKKNKQVSLIAINETELEVLAQNFSKLPTGETFVNARHYFSQDVDLFGKHSFFQYLNRSILLPGKAYLASLLTENTTDAIEEKQEAIKELAQKIDFRQEFMAEASQVKTTTPASTIENWIMNYQNFVPAFAKWLPRVFSLISVGIVLGYFIGVVTGLQTLTWFFIGLIITGVYLKRINILASAIDKTQDTFEQYYKLLQLIETENFSAKRLCRQQEKIASEKEKASVILKRLSKIIDALDQRNNMIFGILGNGFLLWDLRQSYRLENWITAYQNQVKNWFSVITFFDAYNSLGNFAYNHPAYVFPELSKDSEVLIKAKDAVHPLINAEDAVTNNFSLHKNNFFIVTGANMAGKSTFLRTVSLQIIMSNVGLPVRASACEYSPIKLITSMRTVDSLADEASYFFSELQRLKFIVEEIKKDNYFIILDEILKGTNSTDKAIGSKKFIEKLVSSHSSGIIATHDLSLCEVAENFPQVKNYYFDAEIIKDELHFDYTLKNGICKNMNASFLLRKMNIIDE